jgi:hypothetical protein
MKKSLSRRRFLQGMGGLAISLPFLTKFSTPAMASTNGGPKRILLVTYAMGTVTDRFKPSAAGSNFTLPYIAQPLEPFKDRCLFVTGCDNAVLGLNRDHRFGHPAKKESVLTGTLMRNAFSGDKANRVDLVLEEAPDAVEGGPNNESIGNFVGRHIEQSHHVTPSIDLAVAGRAERDHDTVESSFHFEGPANPMSMQANPAAAFNQLFGNLDLDPEAEAALRHLNERNKSVLDGVRASFTDLRQGLDPADRARLDDHADRIRQVELDMQQVTCGAPVGIPGAGETSPSWDHFRSRSMRELASFQIPILANAMACDMSPVGRLEFIDQHNPFFGLDSVDSEVAAWRAASDSASWHSMVHGDPSPIDGVPTRGDDQFASYLLDGYRFFVEQYANLLGALDAIEEGPDQRTALDNTLVVLASDFGDGQGHNSNKLNFVLAGNTGEARTGFHFDCAPDRGFYGASDYNSNQLLNSICRIFGLRNEDGSEVVEFGLEGFARGGIPGIF